METKVKDLKVGKKYKFDWVCPFFEELTDAEFEMGTKIVNMGLIHDVYLLDVNMLISEDINTYVYNQHSYQ